MFEAEKIYRSSTIKLKDNFEQVFPLFGPVREKDWADGWDPHVLLSDSENIEEHMVFQSPSHLEDGEDHYTWIVSKYIPDQGQIEYTVFTESRLWWITIDCKPEPGGESCEATVTYTYVGLTARGNRLNATALEAMFKHDLKDWEHAINHYLETGSVLRHP